MTGAGVVPAWLQAGAGAVVDPRWLLAVNVGLVLLIVGFSVGIATVLVRRSMRQRMEAERAAATGNATARILHQVKNPLQTVILHAEMLQNPAIVADRETRDEVAQAVLSEAGRLSELLAELSMYASGAQRRVQPEPLRLDRLTEEAVRAEVPPGGVHGVEAAIGPLEPLWVSADPYFLRQALGNVLRNAREAMESEEAGRPKRLEAALRRRGAEAVLEVRDTGPGIAAEALAKVTEPFVTTKARGMGLGLAICRDILEAHGGRLELRSRPGAGTTVSFVLPVTAAPQNT